MLSVPLHLLCFLPKHIVPLCHADQEWDRSAAALQQALTTLATNRPTKRPRTHSSAPDQPNPDTQQAQNPSSQHAMGPAAPPPLPSDPMDAQNAGGSVLGGGAPSGTHATAAEGADNAVSGSLRLNSDGVSAADVPACTAADGSVRKAQMVDTGLGLSEQADSGQALHFAHDLLGNLSPCLYHI